MTLLDRPKMSAENNPAGLEPISRGLGHLPREQRHSRSGISISSPDQFEEQLQSGLPDVYVELNALLEGRGIAPTQVRPIQRGAGSVTSSRFSR